MEKFVNLSSKKFRLENIVENNILIVSSCSSGNYKTLSHESNALFRECQKLNEDIKTPFQTKKDGERILPGSFVMFDIGNGKRLIILFGFLYCSSGIFGDDTVMNRLDHIKNGLMKLFDDHSIKDLAILHSICDTTSDDALEFYRLAFVDMVNRHNVESRMLKITMYDVHDVVKKYRYKPNVLKSYDMSKIFIPLIEKIENELNPSWVSKNISELGFPLTWERMFKSSDVSRELKKVSNDIRKDFENYGDTIVFLPELHNLFKPFELCKYSNLKIVIVGQDPYPRKEDAIGLTFSVPRDRPIPGSLKNIYKALENDKKISFKIPEHGDLTKWAEQGVFLINTCLTFRETSDSGSDGKKKNAHMTFWTGFTNLILKKISSEKENIVFMLWGGHAQQRCKIIDDKKHLVLKYIHPSPMNQDKFVSCPHFSKANDYLIEHKKIPIEWQI